MGPVLATVPGQPGRQPRVRTGRFGASRARTGAFGALVVTGFRRYATYRQATLASICTNSVFGFLRCYVLLGALAGAGTASVGGYDAEQLATYCWASQGLIGVVLLWGWTDLSDRIRTGDVISDLLRPIHPVTAYLAVDFGRAGFAALTRFVVPIAVGALTFDLYLPRRVLTYPLFVVSVVFATVICFCFRYLVNASGYWLLDARGVNTLAAFLTTVGAGLAYPLHFMPGWVVTTLWVATPFPSMLQGPLDVLVERDTTLASIGIIAGQAAWAATLLGVC